MGKLQYDHETGEYYEASDWLKPGWLTEEGQNARYRIKNRDTPAEKAWQEGYQAGLWYGKGGEPTYNPYAAETNESI